MSKETKYVRRGAEIREVQGAKIVPFEQFDSVALAKKKSFKLQMEADGALGRGSLRVEG